MLLKNFVVIYLANQLVQILLRYLNQGTQIIPREDKQLL